MLFEMPEGWGVESTLIETVLHPPVDFASEAWAYNFRRDVSVLERAPLFSTSIEPEVEEVFQIEAMTALFGLKEALDRGGYELIEGVVHVARAVSNTLDEIIGDSLAIDPSEAVRQSYLVEVEPAVMQYDLGYFGSRNLEVEFECHRVIAGADGSDVFTGQDGQHLLQICEVFGREYTAAIKAQAFPSY